MTPRTRIGAIYRKELLDVLRDRRTLLAMLLVPVVLYPLVMLVFVRAAESEQVRLRAERIVVEVDDELTRQHLLAILEAVTAEGFNRTGETPAGADRPAAHAAIANSEEPGIGNREPEIHRLFDLDVRVGHTPVHALGEDIHLRVALNLVPNPPPLPPRFDVTISYNEVHVRSRNAMDQLLALFERFRELLARESIADMLRQTLGAEVHPGHVELLLQPVHVETESTATPQQRGGWALGQVVPIILVIMTITGAVYPAIDLTAGERERGTLETLMATPVPILHLVVGKFLVVATVSLMTAALNLASVGATMHFGGLTRALSAELPVEFPLGVLPVMLLCMVPLALLFSAVLVAICSFARTFKEAQNYVMPVMIAAMVPAFVVTLPTVQLQGILLVMPVGNMVLLTRELFLQNWSWTQIIAVVGSTSLYAVAAVAMAARLFGQEAVMFADTRSYRTLLSRRFFQPARWPTPAQGLLLAAVLFPASFYAQSLLSGASLEDFIRTLGWLAVVQFAGLFVLVPVLLAIYLKIDVVETFRLRLPPARAWLGAILLGLSTWILALEFFALQSRVLPPSQALTEFGRQIEAQLAAQPLFLIILLLALVPAVTEEFLFRGFLLSGVANGFRKWSAILTAAAIFGVYHFLIDRMPVTFLMGAVLGYVCWQSRSLIPAILLHAMHNGSVVVLPHLPEVTRRLGLDAESGARVPLPVLAPALVLFAAGLLLLYSLGRTEHPEAAGESRI